MSNNLYDIINKLAAVEQKQEQVQQPKAKTKLAENMETVEGQLNEKYMGFKKTVAAIKKGGSADNPEAVAAAIGREKYGKEKFQQAAARGKKLGEEQDVSEGFGREYVAIEFDRQKYHPDLLLKYLEKQGFKEVSYKNVMNPFMKDVYQYVSPAGRKLRVEYGWLQFKLSGSGLADINFDEVARLFNTDIYQRNELIASGKENSDKQGMAEVAPPGAKAERMVKHIKKGYAKDGKLSDKERSIAYATAWKAHKAGKVEEAVAALTVLARSGMTAEQITEGWEDMMKAVTAKSREEKGTGKFDKKKDPTTGGTVYSRKYNPKTGETDDTENVTAVKRGRGRPKKSAFEQYMQKYETMLEDADPLGKFIQNLPQKGSSAKTAPVTTPAAPTQPMGTIKNGVWSADAPKPGEKGVPLPVPVDESDYELEEMMRLAGMEEALKGGQKKLDKNHNGKLDAEDFAMLRGDAEEEVDEDFKLIPPPAAAKSAEQAKEFGAMAPKEPGKRDPFSPASVPPDAEMEEGNEFSGALNAARSAGKSEFEVDGKTYPVKEEMDEGHEICNECGYTMTECGCDAGHEHDQEGHMNVSMNVDSSGNQSMTVSADGEDAVKLAQLLKLAGLGAGQPEAVYQPVEVVVGDEEEEIEEEKDPRYHASTTPNEQVYGVDALIKGGNGDVAGQEKTMRKHGYQFGDNPIAMKETVARDYESIKVKK